MKFLQSSWVVCLIGCATYLGSTLAFLNPKKIQPVYAQEHEEGTPHEHEAAVLTGPSWEFNNPEVDQIISELRAEKAALADKAKQLAEIEARLKAEERELTVATQAVYRLQAEFDRNVTRIREEETSNLKRLAKLYATMTPEGAANVLRHIEDEQLLKILVVMKESETAPILELMSKPTPEDAKRVAGISERLRLVLQRESSSKK